MAGNTKFATVSDELYVQGVENVCLGINSRRDGGVAGCPLSAMCGHRVHFRAAERCTIA